jgi:hypothetical protein
MCVCCNIADARQRRSHTPAATNNAGLFGGLDVSKAEVFTQSIDDIEDKPWRRPGSTKKKI